MCTVQLVNTSERKKNNISSCCHDCPHPSSMFTCKYWPLLPCRLHILTCAKPLQCRELYLKLQWRFLIKCRLPKYKSDSWGNLEISSTSKYCKDEKICEILLGKIYPMTYLSHLIKVDWNILGWQISNVNYKSTMSTVFVGLWYAKCFVISNHQLRNNWYNWTCRETQLSFFFLEFVFIVL